MSRSVRASSAPGSSRSDRVLGRRAELISPEPAMSRNTQLPPVINQTVPDELLLSLSSVSGPGAHQRHCKGCGLRRPDAVWHHSLGRKKYKFFLEQPTSLTGAGRDISFLCDAVVSHKKTTPLPPLTDRSGAGSRENSGVSESLIPEEYRVVKNKGLQSLEFYEDAFTVQLQDEEQKLHVFPSLRPSGRLEVVQLIKMMDNMLLKAGVEQQSEELTELSQMESLLELVQAEQNIYSIVFHEVIRQVTVNCAERGQLLAKLRQHYQSLLERIPRCLKALHTEAVAQRVLNRRLAEEIGRIRTSFQQLSTALSRIREHDDFVSQQTEEAHQHLAGALEQAQTNSDVVQGYHELYELHRTRLETQLLHMMKDRDCWIQLSVSLAKKIISTKKLHMIKQLHISEQSWFKAAEHCSLYLASMDSQDLNVITELNDQWKEQLVAFMSKLESAEHVQCEQMSIIHQGIIQWLNFCNTQKRCPDPKCEPTSLENMNADLQQWVNMLALHCECYQGETLLGYQEMLAELDRVQKRCLSLSLQLFRRHPTPDGEPPAGQQAFSELDGFLSELLKQLDTRVSGENGVYRQITSLLGQMESWISKFDASISRPETMSVSDWLNLEKALQSWQSSVEKVLQNFSCLLPEETVDVNNPDTSTEIEKVFAKMQDCTTSLFNLSDGENQRLSEEVSSLHMTQTQWMLSLLLFVVPDHSEVQHLEHGEHCFEDISPHTLDEEAKYLIKKLGHLSSYLTSSCKLILEEEALQHPHESEKEMNELRKLQTDCSEWVETCLILLAGLQRGPPEGQTDAHGNCEDASCSHGPALPVDSSCQALINKDGLNEPVTDNTVNGDTEAGLTEDELKDGETIVVKMIGCDGDVTQRKLGEDRVHLSGTKDSVVSPVTDEAQKAFDDLSTVRLLQQELLDSEMRVQSAEQRALKAEEALQSALVKIQDLERHLQGRSSLISEEKTETPPPSAPAPTPSTPTRKLTAEAKTMSGTKKTKRNKFSWSQK
ncbi:axonemal dynein light chain domain-containing protein 1 isoform X2 [Takifugu rubripes]|uniref:axonemal dynein light chain domain-containing protein 1 isoform X2 n=1 Tax=Takifugu rubripes TaxID=31033 RepID=UPI0011452ABE|nr:axonemal dynein light chain domain-containing protein 1 isoform X2 [Takifugu rubripes]